MTDELLKAVARKLAAASGYDPDGTWEEFDRNAAATVTNCGDYEGWQDDVFPKFIRWHEFVPQADAALSLMQPEIDRRVAEERKAQDDRIDALEAALRDVFIHGHSEGWRGNQMRRDVKHEDAEKSWSLYVSNGALEKTKARHRTTSLAAQEVDSGMSGDAVERAKWFWANLPTGRKWAGLATHEKALVCHQIARITPSLAAQDGLVEALEAMLHAVCGETGFANAVRGTTGKAYPWPALDMAEEKARKAISAIKEQHHD